MDRNMRNIMAKRVGRAFRGQRNALFALGPVDPSWILGESFDPSALDGVPDRIILELSGEERRLLQELSSRYLRMGEEFIFPWRR